MFTVGVPTFSPYNSGSSACALKGITCCAPVLLAHPRVTEIRIYCFNIFTISVPGGSVLMRLQDINVIVSALTGDPDVVAMFVPAATQTAR